MGVSRIGVRPGPGSTASNQATQPERHGHRVASLLLAALLTSSACWDDDATSPSRVTSVAIAPTAATIEVGGSVLFKAKAYGGVRALEGVTWQSSAPDVATVSVVGEVLGVSEGSAAITAKAIADPSKFAVASITVYQGVIKSVEIEPDSAFAVRGTTLQLSAVALNTFGARVSGREVLWTIADPLIATVSANGLITASAFGRTNVTATIDGISDMAPVVVGVGSVNNVVVKPASLVLGEGDELTLAAQPFDAAGNVVEDADLFWFSSNPAVATVSEFGVVTAVSLGSAVITARAQNAEGTAAVTVVPASIASIKIAPRPSVLEERDFIQLTATGQDGSGEPVSFPIVWKSSAPSVASVSTNGLVTALSASATPVYIIASAALTATRTIADTVAISVVPASVASMVTTVGKTTIEVGETIQAKVVMYDKRGNILTDRYCEWSTDNPAVVSVDEDGMVVGLAVGDAVVTAESGGTIGSTIVHVVQAAVESVVLTPSSLGLFVGQSMGLTLEVRDKRGGLITGRAVTWSTSDGKIAGVDQTGIVTGNGAGSASVSATVNGKAGHASVVVSWSTSAVASVLVQLAKDALDVGQTTTASAVLFDALGYILTGRGIAWSSSNPAIASVNASGAVNAVGPGVAFIRATSEGKTGEARIVVTAAPWIVGDQQPHVDVPRGAHEIGQYSSGQILAQTFTPNDDRWLGYLSLPVFCPAGGALVVKIREGLGGTVLYTATVNGLPSTRSAALRTIQLFNPTVSSTGLWITGGTTYAFELSSPTAPSLGQCGIMRGPAFDHYAGGAAFHQEGSPAWVPFGTNEDLPFKTHMRH